MEPVIPARAYRPATRSGESALAGDRARGIATKIAGYGYATIAYFAGTTIEAVEKAAARGVFRLDDLGSVARFITAPHKKRTPDHPRPQAQAGAGESIRAA